MKIMNENKQFRNFKITKSRIKISLVDNWINNTFGTY